MILYGLRHYNRYDNSPVMLNEGYIGWQMYMNNRDSIAFDSFIMGNSCTMAYQCHEWENIWMVAEQYACSEMQKA